ncbi:Putative baseplate assembly protein [Rubrivivax sp. A210]|uniref:putative baseplate assembly protein n=1 Tax=Rubrivivax sp. A210 TaxID=2772301 RepID=UPI001918DB82|nr:putative baseplate assembly protein [Rubrivivax sp. A210]CAD5367085.1 Putative baseplate assembly protein [Rubrivivax sp. A210]
MDTPDLFFDLRRRNAVRGSALNGIDDVELGADRRSLRLRLFKAPAEPLDAGHIRIEGGARVRDIVATDLRLDDAAPEGAADFIVTLSREGDYATYTLRLGRLTGGRFTNLPGFDPVFSRAPFRFRVAGADLDCQATAVAASQAPAEPGINYLARDYASLRRVLLDRLAVQMPQWRETHVPDVGLTLVEIMAYVGDHLSYQQDAAATEAYLSTAHQRISVRRHARLLDYLMHEGCNARTWVQLRCAADVLVPEALNLRFVTDWAPDLPPSQAVVDAAVLADVQASRYFSFVPVWPGPLPLFAALNEIRLHDWGSATHVLPRGSTCATLVDGEEPDAPAPAGEMQQQQQARHRKPSRTQVPAPAPAPRQRMLRHLKAGDFLLLQQARNPVAGLAADADTSQRQVVRLTRVETATDPLGQMPVVQIEWAVEDALSFDLVVRAGCHAADDAPMAVAGGNLVLADEGRPVIDETPQALARGGLRLAHGPLVFRTPANPLAPAASLGQQSARAALPQIELRAIPGRSDGRDALFGFADLDEPASLARALARELQDPAHAADAAQAELLARLDPPTLRRLRQTADPSSPDAEALAALRDNLRRLQQTWLPRPDLLDSGPDDLHFVVEVDNAGGAQLRFGNGECGRRPDAGARYRASYRVSAGEAGNVGTGALTHLVLSGGGLADIALGQPLPALGGTAPEAVADVKQLAPTAFRTQLTRAVTAADYALLAGRNAGVQRAAATLRFNGHRGLVRVAIDPLGSGALAPKLAAQLRAEIEPCRRLGHEVEIVAARYLPLDITMVVQVQPGHVAKHVKQALQQAFGTGRLPDGTRAFFHPDQLSFGQNVEMSRLIAGAQRIAGVDSVTVTRLERLHQGPDGELQAGVLKVGALEIARVDNDPNFPEFGRFTVQTRGGR